MVFICPIFVPNKMLDFRQPWTAFNINISSWFVGLHEVTALEFSLQGPLGSPSFRVSESVGKMENSSTTDST